MTKLTKITLAAAVVVTLAALVTWQVTGGDYYTKFEVVEQVEKEVDPDDPLAATGFYDGSSQTETVARDDFRFGLLPTPAGLFDKHMLSVVSTATPFWVLAIALALWTYRRRKKMAVGA